MKRLFFVFPMLLGKLNLLFLFSLHLLSSFQSSMLFPTGSFPFLAFSSHNLTSEGDCVGTLSMIDGLFKSFGLHARKREDFPFFIRLWMVEWM